MIDEQALARAIDQAETLRLFDLADLERVLAHNPGRHGLHPLRALLSSLDPDTKLTRSNFERHLLAIIERAGLPRPEVNAPLELEGQRIEVDFLWRSERLVLEADGWETHSTRRAFVRDRSRDRLLLRAGYRTARVTWTDSESEVIATIRAALAA